MGEWGVPGLRRQRNPTKGSDPDFCWRGRVPGSCLPSPLPGLRLPKMLAKEGTCQGSFWGWHGPNIAFLFPMPVNQTTSKLVAVEKTLTKLGDGMEKGGWLNFHGRGAQFWCTWRIPTVRFLTIPIGWRMDSACLWLPQTCAGYSAGLLVPPQVRIALAAYQVNLGRPAKQTLGKKLWAFRERMEKGHSWLVSHRGGGLLGHLGHGLLS